MRKRGPGDENGSDFLETETCADGIENESLRQNVYCESVFKIVQPHLFRLWLVVYVLYDERHGP